MTGFRVAEDRSLADIEDDAVPLPEDAQVRIAHPLTMSTETMNGWAEVFADYEILQPFKQLGRPVHTLSDRERESERLGRFEGVTVPTGKLLGLLRRGWERSAPQDAGVEPWFLRRIRPDLFLMIDLAPGLAVGMIDEFPEQRLEAIWLNDRPHDYSRRKTPRRFGDLDPVIASEVLADLTELTT